MEPVITYGIIYLLVFRLAVLLLGGLCIFWGYRLFLISQSLQDCPFPGISTPEGGRND